MIRSLPSFHLWYSSFTSCQDLIPFLHGVVSAEPFNRLLWLIIIHTGFYPKIRQISLGNEHLILVVIAGILLPLGLSEGLIVATNFRQVNVYYVPDASVLSLTTTPTRDDFVFGYS